MHQLILLGRGVTRRCPVCGSGRLFTRWLQMVDRCPRCGWVFEREEGYWVGAMTLNIVAAELFFVIFLAVAVFLTWPDLPVAPLIALGVILQVAFPILFYPFSKTLWVAIDLAFFNRLPRERLRI